jgi:dCMP deaminase
MRNIHGLMMGVAWLFAKQSYCKRRQVGAVLVKDNRILATGYNGTISGRSNNCEDGDTTLQEVLHAEQNVIAFAAKHGIPMDGCTLYVTTNPCQDCAKMLVQSGIKEVVYQEVYRDIKGLELLGSNSVRVVRWISNERTTDPEKDN